MNARPFFSLTDEVLNDLSRRADNLSPWVCPDVKAKIRAAIADLPKPRQRLRDFIECNDANGEQIALVPYLIPSTNKANDSLWDEVTRAYVQRFGVKWDDVEHDPETDIISASDRILGCLSVVTRGA